MMNLATYSGWSFAMASMEKKKADHAVQLIEKHVGKPFYEPFSNVRMGVGARVGGGRGGVLNPQNQVS